MTDKDLIEKIRFDDNGLVPVIAQDIETKETLMLAWVDKANIINTIETGLAHYYSRSRKEKWLKGETSGCYQHVEKILLDCDEDAVLYMVKQTGAACHTGSFSCFFNVIFDKFV